MSVADPGLLNLIQAPARELRPRLVFSVNDVGAVRRIKAVVGQAISQLPTPEQQAVASTVDIVVRPLIILEVVAAAATITSAVLLYHAWQDRQAGKKKGKR